MFVVAYMLHVWENITPDLRVFALTRLSWTAFQLLGSSQQKLLQRPVHANERIIAIYFSRFGRMKRQSAMNLDER